MTTRTWRSPAEGSTVPLIVMDLNGWTEFREDYEIFTIDDLNADVAAVPFDQWTESEFTLKIMDSFGGTVITTTTGTADEISYSSDGADGKLVFIVPEAATGAIQAFLEAAGQTISGTVFGHCTGLDPSGTRRAIFDTRIHLRFGEAV